MLSPSPASNLATFLAKWLSSTSRCSLKSNSGTEYPHELPTWWMSTVMMLLVPGGVVSPWVSMKLVNGLVPLSRTWPVW